MNRAERHQFQYCQVIIDRDNTQIITSFDDSHQVKAIPQPDPESCQRATSLGYRGTPRQQVDAMTLDHDLLHTLLAEAEGLPYSPTLHAVAHGHPLAPGEAEREERRVMLAHRLLNLTSLHELLPGEQGEKR